MAMSPSEVEPTGLPFAEDEEKLVDVDVVLVEKLTEGLAELKELSSIALFNFSFFSTEFPFLFTLWAAP